MTTISVFDITAFTRGYIECALWSSAIEDLPERRRKALSEEIASARRLGRDPQRQLCELYDLDDVASDTSMQSWGFTADDLAPKARTAIDAECADFVQHQLHDLLAYCLERTYDPAQGSIESYAGHDFWLTRNRHGAGFWDRGLGELGDRLTSAAKAYGTSDLYVGDDERIHVT